MVQQSPSFSEATTLHSLATALGDSADNNKVQMALIIVAFDDNDASNEEHNFESRTRKVSDFSLTTSNMTNKHQHKSHRC